MQVEKSPPISSSNPIGSPQLRLESKRQGAVNDGPHHLLPPPLSFPCFTTPPAPPSPISLSRAIGKPGPSAANDFEAGCGVAITRRLGRPRARLSSARVSPFWELAHNSTVGGVGSTWALFRGAPCRSSDCQSTGALRVPTT